MSKEKLVIIDGNAIVHRAYHALPPMTTKDGLMVNAVYGFASMLLKVWKNLDPEYLAVSFDMPGKTFRHEKYADYKATRVKADQELYDQIPLAHKLAEAFNIPIFEKSGYEADDIIGTIVEKMKNEKDLEVYIATGDMDTLQLVDKNVKVYGLRKGMSDIVVYDEKAVKDKYGFGPEMIVDYKALRGDPSDNIPGVSGVGEKTATELIQKIGGVDEIYRQLKNEKSKLRKEFKEGVIKKLTEGKKEAEMSKELATIDRDAPKVNFELKKAVLRDFDIGEVEKLFQKFEFVSLVGRIPGYEQKEKTGQSSKKMSKFEFSEVSDKKAAQELADEIKKEKKFYCQAVLGSKDIFEKNLSGLVLLVNGRGYFVKKELDKLFSVFNDSEIVLCGHDLKQLLKILFLFDVKVNNKLFDLMIASYLLNPGSRAHDSSDIIFKNLGKKAENGSNQDTLFGVNARERAYELYLLSLCEKKLKDELESIDNSGLFEKIEMPTAVVLAKVELNGVALDSGFLREIAKDVDKKITETENKIFDLAGEKFNVASPIQLREVLFEKLEIPSEGIKKGKTGLSTSAEQLGKLRGLHPIIPLIEDYREFSKLKNTYIDVLPTLVNKHTGRIHTDFNQAVTATGRLSSSDPNLQNIPIRTEMGHKIRRAFTAEKGDVLLAADYSQIELRIVASLAKDKKMMEIFKNNEDIHRATAAAIHGVPLKEVTKAMRRSAKEVNFGVLYGMGSYGLSWRAEIPLSQAKEFIEKYFEQFSGVKKYIDRTLEFTRKEGYCETLFGRRRYIPELNSKNFQLRSAAERMAINHPIQGTAADLMKMAMIETQKEIEKYGKDVRMILQVHDELVLEVKKEKAEEIASLLKKTMEEVVELNVPVEVEVGIGENWGEIK